MAKWLNDWEGKRFVNSSYLDVPRLMPGLETVPFYPNKKPKPNYSKPGKKRSTAVYYGNQGGYAPVRTSKKKRRKRRKKYNVQKEIRSIKKKVAIEKNLNTCHHVMKRLENDKVTAAINEMSGDPSQTSIGAKGDVDTLMTYVKRNYYDAASAKGTVTYDMNAQDGWTCELKHYAKICVKNNDLTPTYLYFYDLVATSDHSQTPGAVFENYVADYSTSHAASVDIKKDPRYMFSDGRYFRDFWKAVQFKKIYLKPGDETWFFIETKRYHFAESENDARQENYLKGKSHFAYFTAHGCPVHGDNLANIGLSSVEQVDMVIWLEDHIWFRGEDNTLKFRSQGASAIYGNLDSMLNPAAAGVDVKEENV